jgi:hypothetical protein
MNPNLQNQDRMFFASAANMGSIIRIFRDPCNFGKPVVTEDSEFPTIEAKGSRQENPKMVPHFRELPKKPETHAA